MCANIGERCIVAGEGGFSSSFLICNVLGKHRKIKNRSMCNGMVARLVSGNPLPHVKKPGHLGDEETRI